MKKLFFFLITCILLLSFGCKRSSTGIKAAFVYVGSISDGGWTASHDEGRLALMAEFPDIQTAYVESVPEGHDAEQVITTFAQKGFDIIFTTSFGFMDPTINVADKFPKTVFMNCSGYKRAKNVGTYFGRMYQAKYLAGLMAGKMTKSNTIGYVAPHPIPEVIRHINAFTLGVKKVNSNAKVKIVWTNSWFDLEAEKTAAYSLIESGADIITTGADSTAPLLAAEEKEGIYSIGYDSDASEIVPKSFLTAPMWKWIYVYRDVVEKVRNKEIEDWSVVDYWNGLDTGIVDLAPMTELVPSRVKRMIMDEKAKVIRGEEKIFKGPIKKQDGSIAVESGKVITDEELLSMMYFVQGVE